MNLTLAIAETVLARAREVARQQGKSLNALIRDYLERLADHREGDALAEEILALFEAHPGDSGGRPVRRGDAYKGRL
ncbi:MAG: hypothetical protein IPG96_07820 [Proteobacteria bacterium]|nr:hypothetical protein [Pseudomonadota bacterium]